MSAYLIGLMEITDPLEFVNYIRAAGRALAPFAGRFKPHEYGGVERLRVE